MVGFCLGIRVSGVFVGKGIEKRSERVGAKEARIGVRDFLIITALKVEMISIHLLSLIYMRVPSLLFLLISFYCFSSQGSEYIRNSIQGTQYRDNSGRTAEWCTASCVSPCTTGLCQQHDGVAFQLCGCDDIESSVSV